MKSMLTNPANLRSHARTIVTTSALLAVILELGGIWNEVHQMRREQVKNSLYSLPEERQEAVRATGRGKKLESTVTVNGSVEVEGDIHMNEPVEVEVVR